MRAPVGALLIYAMPVLIEKALQPKTPCGTIAQAKTANAYWPIYPSD